MPEPTTLSQRWDNYRPSKATWLWSIVGAAVLTMILGFTAGGWTTGGSAALMAERAAQDARAELAASVCVDHFAASADAAQQFAALKKKSSWERDDFIKAGGWAKLLGDDHIIRGAASRCAENLVALDQLPNQSAEATTVGG
jgi:hypothetical protein